MLKTEVKGWESSYSVGGLGGGGAAWFPPGPSPHQIATCNPRKRSATCKSPNDASSSRFSDWNRPLRWEEGRKPPPPPWEQSKCGKWLKGGGLQSWDDEWLCLGWHILAIINQGGLIGKHWTNSVADWNGRSSGSRLDGLQHFHNGGGGRRLRSSRWNAL